MENSRRNLDDNVSNVNLGISLRLPKYFSQMASTSSEETSQKKQQHIFALNSFSVVRLLPAGKKTRFLTTCTPCEAHSCFAVSPMTKTLSQTMTECSF